MNWVDVNICDGNDIGLIVVCFWGYLCIVDKSSVDIIL